MPWFPRKDNRTLAMFFSYWRRGSGGLSRLYIFSSSFKQIKMNNWYTNYTLKKANQTKSKNSACYLLKVDGYLLYIALIYLQYKFPPLFLLHTKVSKNQFCSFMGGVICQMRVSNKIKWNKHVGKSYKFI